MFRIVRDTINKVKITGEKIFAMNIVAKGSISFITKKELFQVDRK